MTDYSRGAADGTTFSTSMQVAIRADQIVRERKAIELEVAKDALIADLKADGMPKCSMCSGSGKILQGHRTCPDCGGTGGQRGKAALGQYRTGDGRYTGHRVDIGSHDRLVGHLANDHGATIDPAIRTSTRTAAQVHAGLHCPAQVSGYAADHDH